MCKINKILGIEQDSDLTLFSSLSYCIVIKNNLSVFQMFHKWVSKMDRSSKWFGVFNRGSLPKYGLFWTAAVKHTDITCRNKLNITYSKRLSVYSNYSEVLTCLLGIDTSGQKQRLAVQKTVQAYFNRTIF